MTLGSRLQRVALIAALTFWGSADNAADTWTDRANQIVALENHGQVLQALQAVTRLIEDLRQLEPADALLPSAIDRKASLELDLGKYRDSERDFLEAIKLWKTASDAPSLPLATEFNNLASLYSMTGRMTKAEAFRRSSLELRLRLLHPRDPEIALSYSNLAADLYQQGRYSEGAEFCHKALAIWAKTAPANDRSELALNTMALIELHGGSPQTAFTLALAALARSRADENASPSRIAAYERTVALARAATGRPDLAEQDFRISLQLLNQSSRTADSFMRIDLLTDYARLLKQLNRRKEAKHLMHEAEALKRELARASEQPYTVDVKALLPSDARRW